MSGRHCQDAGWVSAVVRMLGEWPSSGQILKLVVWTKIEVYSIQLSVESTTIPFSAFSVI